jgi:hypothetical protein
MQTDHLEYAITMPDEAHQFNTGALVDKRRSVEQREGIGRKEIRSRWAGQRNGMMSARMCANTTGKSPPVRR